MIEIGTKICYYSFMDNASEKYMKIFETIEGEFDELGQLVSAVEVMSDHKLYSHYLKRIKKIEGIANKFKNYKSLLKDIEFFGEFNDSPNEVQEISKKAEELFAELVNDYAESLDKQDERVQVEICSKEDDLLVEELVKIFENFCKLKDFEFDSSLDAATEVMTISGENVYNSLSVFSGKVKKVYRGNETNASVVVLDIQNQEIEINPEDLIIQTSKSSGAGGQHINKTESAVKIIHVPTGIFAECQDERSQTKNKENAMQRLIQKITQNTKEKAEKHEKNQRKELKDKLFGSTPAIVLDFDLNKLFVKSNKTEYKLKEILEGNLDLIVNNNI